MLRVQQALRMRVGQPWQRNLVGDRHQEGHPEAGGRHHSDPSRNHPGKVFDRSFGDIPWRSSGEPCWSWYWSVPCSVVRRRHGHGPARQRPL